MTRSPAEPENPPPDLAPCSPKDHNRRPAMNLNSDFGARAAVHAARLDWDRCRHRPGVIDTPIWTKLPISAGSDAPVDPKEVARAGLSLGGAGEVQDIANGALFLPLRRGAGNRRRYDGRCTTLAGAELGWRERKPLPASAKCDFRGKPHSNIFMEDSAKLALARELLRATALKGASALSQPAPVLLGSQGR